MHDAVRMRRTGSDYSSDDMFVASSGSASSSDAETSRTSARRRLRQNSQPVREKRRRSAVDDGGSDTTRRSPTVIVLDSDSDASDSKQSAPAALLPATSERPATDATTSAEQWACSKCTFLNDAANSLCEICTSPCPTRKLRNMTQWLAPAATLGKPALPPVPAASTVKARKHGHEPLTEVIDSSGESDADERDRAAPSRASVQSLHHARRFHSPAAQTTATSRALWADAYAPSSIDELCVNKKKVAELAEWLTRATAATSASVSVHPRKRLLFLCGPPGCGKSTAVRCLAKRMRVEIKEWSDNSAAGKLSYDRMLAEQYWTQQTSGVDDFMDFIARSVTYAALPVATVAPTRKRRLARRAAATAPPVASSGHVILIESWPQSWSKQDATWDDRVQRIFRRIVDPAAQTQFPVVCIFSDVRESKIDLARLAKLFSPDVLHSPLTTVMHFNSVTAAQVKKQVVRIADAERCSLSTAEIQQVVDKSSGDVRHAINTLQLVVQRSQQRRKLGSSLSAVSAQRSTKTKKPSTTSGNGVALRLAEARGGGGAAHVSDSDSEQAAHRDAFLSDFHVVGKILHGKIVKASESKGAGAATSSKRGDFDRMVDTSAMSLDKVLELVHANCVEYFTDVEDLSNAFELLSATETMLAESYRGNANTEVFKRIRDVAQAILVRSIALTNDHPAPSAFRPITAARSFATRQRVAWKRDEMLRFTTASPGGSYHYLCSGDTFAFDVEPYLSAIGSSRSHASQATSAGDDATRDEVDDAIESSDGGW